MRSLLHATDLYTQTIFEDIFYVFASSLKFTRIMYGVHGVDHVSARGECCAVIRIHNAIWNSIFLFGLFMVAILCCVLPIHLHTTSLNERI